MDCHAHVVEHFAGVGLRRSFSPVFAEDLDLDGVLDVAGAQHALRQRAITDVCVVFPGRGEDVPEGFEPLTHTIGGVSVASPQERHADEPCICLRRGCPAAVGPADQRESDAAVAAKGDGDSSANDDVPRLAADAPPQHAPVVELAVLERHPRPAKGADPALVSKAPAGFELVFKSASGRDANLNRCSGRGRGAPLFFLLRRLGSDAGGAGDEAGARYHQRSDARPLLEIGLVRARAPGGGVAQADGSLAEIGLYEPAEELPAGWNYLARPLPLAVGRRGGVGAEAWSVGVFLAFRRAPAAGLCDVRYVPELLVRHPLGAPHGQLPASTQAANKAGPASVAAAAEGGRVFPLPADELPLFCFPFGCELRYCCADELPAPCFFSFQLTLANAELVYASCLAVFEPLQPDQLEQLHEQLPAWGHTRPANGGEGAGSLAQGEERRQVISGSASKARALLGLEEKKGDEPPGVENPAACSDADGRDPRGLLPRVYACSCFVLLSRHPWLESHRDLLRQLHSDAAGIAAAHEHGAVVRAGLWAAQAIQRLCYIPAPIAGGVPLAVQLSAEAGITFGTIARPHAAERIQRIAGATVYALPPLHGLPAVDLRLERLFCCLSPRTVTHILALLLLECRVVLLSRSHSLPSDCGVLLRALLFPFEWQGALISRLPYNLWAFLDAPGACLVGITARPLGTARGSEFGVVDVLRNCEVPSSKDRALYVVDLDRDVIASHEGSVCLSGEASVAPALSPPWLPCLPSRLQAPLLAKLEWACSYFGVTSSFQARACADSGAWVDSADVADEETPQVSGGARFDFLSAVRCAVLQCHSDLLRDYREFMTPPTLATVRQEEWIGIVDDWFNVQGYVAARRQLSDEESVFVRSWSRTQLFARFIHDIAEESSRDEALLFFEQFVTRRRSAFVARRDAANYVEDPRGSPIPVELTEDDECTERILRAAANDLASCSRAEQRTLDDDEAVFAPVLPNDGASGVHDSKPSLAHVVGTLQPLSVAGIGAVECDSSLDAWWRHLNFASEEVVGAPDIVVPSVRGTRTSVTRRVDNFHAASRSPAELQETREALKEAMSYGGKAASDERALELSVYASSLRGMHEGELRSGDKLLRKARRKSHGSNEGQRWLNRELADCWDAAVLFRDGSDGDESDGDDEPVGTTSSDAPQIRAGDRLVALLAPARFMLREVFGAWFLLLPRWLELTLTRSEVRSADSMDDTADEKGSTASSVRIIEMALGTLQQMRDLQLKPDEAMYRSLLGACGQGGPKFSRDAVGLFKEMRNDGIITPNVLTLGLYSSSVVNYHRFFRRKQAAEAHAASNEGASETSGAVSPLAQSPEAGVSAGAARVRCNSTASDLAIESSPVIESGEKPDNVLYAVTGDQLRQNELQSVGASWRRRVREELRSSALPSTPGLVSPPSSPLARKRSLWSRVFRTPDAKPPAPPPLDAASDGEEKVRHSASPEPTPADIDEAGGEFAMPTLADLRPVATKGSGVDVDTLPIESFLPEYGVSADGGRASGLSRPRCNSMNDGAAALADLNDGAHGDTRARCLSVLEHAGDIDQFSWLQRRVVTLWVRGCGDELEEQALASWTEAPDDAEQPKFTLHVAIGPVKAYRNRGSTAAVGDGAAKVIPVDGDLDEPWRWKDGVGEWCCSLSSPLELRPRLEECVRHEGSGVLSGPTLRGSHPSLYWNLIWYCMRASLPIPLADCFADLDFGQRGDRLDLLCSQALSPPVIVVARSRARAFESAAQFRNNATEPPKSALSCVRGVAHRTYNAASVGFQVGYQQHPAHQEVQQSQEELDAAGMAAVLSALCSPDRPVQQGVKLFLRVRKEARAKATARAELSSSIFESCLYLVLLRLVQGFSIMDCVLPTSAKRVSELPKQHSGTVHERVLLPVFEQKFMDALVVGAAGGFGADIWHHFDWDFDVPRLSMASIAARSVFGAFS